MLNKDALSQNIISLLGLEALSDEKKVQILNQATDLVQQRIVLRIIDQLSSEDKDAFLDAVAAEDSEKIAAALSGKVDNIDQLIQEEAEKVKSELKGVIDSLGV